MYMKFVVKVQIFALKVMIFTHVGRNITHALLQFLLTNAQNVQCTVTVFVWNSYFYMTLF